MLGRLLTRLYSHLLKLYPDRFLDEFGEEMGDVFALALSGLDDSRTPPATRRVKMARLFFREVCYFPPAYLDARRYQVSLGAGETHAGRASYGEGEVTEAWVGRRAPWGEALIGALPFLLFGLAYLTPGLSKLEAAVSDGWATTHNLVSILWLKWLELYLYEPAFQLPPRIDALPFPFLTLGGLGVILFETAFILLVLLRPARPLLALAGVGFHMGNQLFLHISFTSLMVAYVSLGDWTAMGRGLYRWFKRRELVVLYDGGCRLCRRTVALLKAADLFDQLVPVAGFSQDPGRGRYAVVTDEMLARDLHVVDGERVGRLRMDRGSNTAAVAACLADALTAGVANRPHAVPECRGFASLRPS